jgi:hypothetical protein
VYVILIMMSMVRKCRKGRAYKLNNCVWDELKYKDL